MQKAKKHPVFKMQHNRDAWRLTLTGHLEREYEILWSRCLNPGNCFIVASKLPPLLSVWSCCHGCGLRLLFFTHKQLSNITLPSQFASLITDDQCHMLSSKYRLPRTVMTFKAQVSLWLVPTTSEAYLNLLRAKNILVPALSKARIYTSALFERFILKVFDGSVVQFVAVTTGGQWRLLIFFFLLKKY